MYCFLVFIVYYFIIVIYVLLNVLLGVFLYYGYLLFYVKVL